MNALSSDLWSQIALSLASCPELRSIADAVKDLCSVRSINTKSRNSCSQAFAELAAMSRKPDVPDATGGSLSAQTILHYELQLCERDKIFRQAAAAQALQEKETSDRKQTMQSHLSDRGLELRDDSRLCSAYIQRGTGNPAKIADTMLEMDWLFRHTSYSVLVQNVSLSLRIC